MADKTEKQHDLGVLEEDDEFEEFPAEDWKVRDRNMILNYMFFIKINLTVFALLIIYYNLIRVFSCHVKNIINKGNFF